MVLFKLLWLIGGLNLLIIDSREKSVLSRLVEMYAKNLNIPVEKKWLEVGDYVMGNVCL